MLPAPHGLVVVQPQNSSDPVLVHPLLHASSQSFEGSRQGHGLQGSVQQPTTRGTDEPLHIGMVWLRFGVGGCGDVDDMLFLLDPNVFFGGKRGKYLAPAGKGWKTVHFWDTVLSVKQKLTSENFQEEMHHQVLYNMA